MSRSQKNVAFVHQKWLAGNKRSHLRTRMEHLVTLQQVAEGEIRRVVFGLLPRPWAVALDDQRHGDQLL